MQLELENTIPLHSKNDREILLRGTHIHVCDPYHSTTTKKGYSLVLNHNYVMILIVTDITVNQQHEYQVRKKEKRLSNLLCIQLT